MRISILALASAMTLSAATETLADVGDAIVGGIIGGVIVNEANKNRQRQTKRVYRAPANAYSPARAEAREIQTALNYFGFPAGTPDGVLGNRSRGAISQYQAHLNYPVTGYLTEYEKSFLLSSYHRAIAGGPVTHQQIAANPMGTRGLLLTYRDEAAGVTAAGPVAPPPAPAPETQLVTAPSQSEAAPAAKAMLPNFGAAPGTGEQASLASHCNTISLVTNTNGGFTTLASMDDPETVLAEQFCLARTYAIAEGEQLATAIKGATSSQIAAQCQAFGPVMESHVAALPTRPMSDILPDVSGFAMNAGMSPEQLRATSKICLSVGYRTDDMDVAIGSALILVALGQQPYAELLGHHLGQGFGVASRQDLASGWYELAVAAVEGGQAPVFAPGQPERTALIRAAALDGGVAIRPATALPSFEIGK